MDENDKDLVPQEKHIERINDIRMPSSTKTEETAAIWYQCSPCFFILCNSSLCPFSSELCRLISCCCCCCTSSWPWSWFPISAPPPAPSAPPMSAPATG